MSKNEAQIRFRISLIIVTILTGLLVWVIFDHKNTSNENDSPRTTVIGNPAPSAITHEGKLNDCRTKVVGTSLHVICPEE